MNSEFPIDETSALLTTNPLLILACLLGSIFLAWVSAYVFRNTSDFSKSTKLYIVLGVVEVIIFEFVSLPILFAIGCVLCGFVLLTWISNYYFYH